MWKHVFMLGYFDNYKPGLLKGRRICVYEEKQLSQWANADTIFEMRLCEIITEYMKNIPCT